jgi:hypothetical protein
MKSRGFFEDLEVATRIKTRNMNCKIRCEGAACIVFSYKSSNTIIKLPDHERSCFDQPYAYISNHASKAFVIIRVFLILL